jgi:hypothetical protein
MAHTSKQQRLSESDNAQRASVTSNTIAYSSTDDEPSSCCWMLWNDFVPGDIFSKNISDNKARRSETETKVKGLERAPSGEQVEPYLNIIILDL